MREFDVAMGKMSKIDKGGNSKLFVLACWGMLSIGMVFGSIGPLLVPISETFRLRIAQVGLPIVCNSAGFFSASILLALLWKVRRVRIFLIAPSLVASLALASIGLVRTTLLLLAALFLVGISQGLLHTSLDCFFSEISGEQRTRRLNWLHVFYGIGAIIGPLLVAIVLTFSDKWRLVYVLVGLLSLPLPILFWRSSLYQGSISFSPTLTPAGQGLTRPIASPLFWLAALAMLLYVGIEVSFGSWTPVFLTRVRDLSIVSASYAISVFWVSIVVGRFLFGTFFHKTNLSLSLVVGTLAAALFSALTFMLKGHIPMILLIALSGLSISWFYPSVIALGANTFPEHIGFMTGALAASGTSGSMLFPWLIGPVSEALGLERSVFLVPLLCIALAGIFTRYALCLLRTKP